MERWQRLGGLIRGERRRLGLRTLDGFARRSGVSGRVLSDLERGARANYDPETIGLVEHALGWEPGSIDRILSGGQPEREGADELDRLASLWPMLSEQDRRALLAAAQVMAGR